MKKHIDAEKKVNKIENILDRMEKGLYTGISIGYVTDQIAWLWKFRYINSDKLTELTTRTINVINTFNTN